MQCFIISLSLFSKTYIYPLPLPLPLRLYIFAIFSLPPSNLSVQINHILTQVSFSLSDYTIIQMAPKGDNVVVSNVKLERIFSMKGGKGEASYANNSQAQVGPV